MRYTTLDEKIGLDIAEEVKNYCNRNNLTIDEFLRIAVKKLDRDMQAK